MDSYLKEKGLSWDDSIHIYTDGAKSMTGKHRGFVASVKSIVPEIGSRHCNIYRHEGLVKKKMRLNFQNIFTEAVKIVNFIKSKPMNARLFTALCEEMGSEFQPQLLHTVVTWFFSGQISSPALHTAQ